MVRMMDNIEAPFKAKCAQLKANAIKANDELEAQLKLTHEMRIAHRRASDKLSGLRSLRSRMAAMTCAQGACVRACVRTMLLM